MKQLLTCIALLATSSNAAAWPSQEVETHSIRVGYADLDIGSAQGQAVLHRRTETAIRRVCAEPESSSLDTRSRQAACKAEARQNVDSALRGIALAEAGSGVTEQAMLQPTKR